MDNIKPTQREIDEFRLYVMDSFRLKREIPVNIIYVRKQSWERLRSKSSITGNAIRLGDKTFTRGLGTHADSVLDISLTQKTKRFKATVGIDYNASIASEGQVVFEVVCDNKVCFKTDWLDLNSKPVDIDCEISGDAFQLKVTAKDGNIHYAHADWADARVETQKGDVLFLDDFEFCNINRHIPFSFTLGGRHSREFLDSWKQETIKTMEADYDLYNISWTDPGRLFRVNCELKVYKDFPAADWLVRLTNTSQSNSPVIENINCMDFLYLGEPYVELRGIRGSCCDALDFVPFRHLARYYTPESCFEMGSRDGRVSETHLPFWTLLTENTGMVCALGWTGNWKATFKFTQNSKHTLTAGFKDMSFFLKPGESVRIPRALILKQQVFDAVKREIALANELLSKRTILEYQGNDFLRLQNMFRRFMCKHILPRMEGNLPAFSAMCSGPYYNMVGVTEQNQIDFIKHIASWGVDVFWIDAGWYDTFGHTSWDWTGSWYPDKKRFPNGLKPVGAEAHKNGLKFILWFEPERIRKGSELWNEHPEWVIKIKDKFDGCFKLGDPQARAWLLERISSIIEDGGVDIYRHDFNFDPGPSWSAEDEEGRKGITEIRHVEGLYDLWDSIKKRFPGILIDTSTSGARRIDLETCMRSIVLTRSDVPGFPEDRRISTENQSQVTGLSLYLPAHAGTNDFYAIDKYSFRSALTQFLLPSYPYERFGEGKFPAKELKEIIEETNRFKHLFYGDFYPLTPHSPDDDAFCAYQFNDAEKGEGFLMCFRRPDCPIKSADFVLRGLYPNSDYEFTNFDTGEKFRGLGNKMKGISIEIKNKGESLLIYYCKVV